MWRRGLDRSLLVQESFITHLETMLRWSKDHTPRPMERLIVKCLNRVLQRRSVLLLKDVLPDLNDSVRANPEKVSIECRVM